MCLAVPGKILSLTGEDISRIGRVSFGGTVREVNLAWVPEAKAGDYVLVHVGFAISVIEESEALQVFEYLKQMNDLDGLDTANANPATGTVEN